MELPSNTTIRTKKVFKWFDYAIYIPLTTLRVVFLIYFLIYWTASKDWLYYPFSYTVLSLIVLICIAIDQLRWFSLPFMRRPCPIPPRIGWRVGVATTFVPGLESLEMLEQTVKALVNLDYPHETWVLDEGGSNQVRVLCQKLGADYFSRKNLPRYQTDSGLFRSHSKHGNYNAWLYEVGFDRYDIITAFDPDHVPERVFLSHVLGYFEDSKVAYVQAAQAYYNQKASFIARGAAEETYGYYSSTLMASYGMGNTVVIGCHNTHRVTALRHVGGFAPHDADDLLIALFYRKCGWEGVYVPEILARGLTPVDWNGYLMQQLRWARSVLDIKYNLYHKVFKRLSFMARTLNLLQGISYIYGLIILLGLVQLVFMLITGTMPYVLSPRIFPKVLALYLGIFVCNMYRQRFFLDVKNEWGLQWRRFVLQFAKWPFLAKAFFDIIIGYSKPYVTTRKLKLCHYKYVLIYPNIFTAIIITTSWIMGIMYAPISNPILHILTGLVILASVCLIGTEFLKYPDPFDRKLLEEECFKAKDNIMT